MVIHQFITLKNNHSFIISPDFFGESKSFILVEIPYCEENENASKHFIKKFKTFTNPRYRIASKQIIRKVKSLFKVKSKNLHSSCVIYRGKYSCGEESIRETERNVGKSWKNVGRNITTQQKKLNQQDTCFVTSSLVCVGNPDACSKRQTRRNLEVLFIGV